MHDCGFTKGNNWFRYRSRRNKLEESRRYATFTLAHDLKVPLTVISRCTQNIRENIKLYLFSFTVAAII